MPGAVRAELGGEWEEPSRQTSSLGRDADDADTNWAHLQSSSLFSSPQLKRFLVGLEGGELPVTGSM